VNLEYSLMIKKTQVSN